MRFMGREVSFQDLSVKICGYSNSIFSPWASYWLDFLGWLSSKHLVFRSPPALVRSPEVAAGRFSLWYDKTSVLQLRSLLNKTGGLSRFVHQVWLWAANFTFRRDSNASLVLIRKHSYLCSWIHKQLSRPWHARVYLVLERDSLIKNPLLWDGSTVHV